MYRGAAIVIGESSIQSRLGPDSAGVLNLVVELEAETVIGNHERAFLRYLKTGSGEFDFREVKHQLDSELSGWQRWLAGWCR